MKQYNYDDIINLPHHISTKYSQMSIDSRAVQFAPFSALAGYEEAIQETSRQTDKRIEIDEDLKDSLNNKIQFLQSNIEKNPEITITYFVYDQKKEGGKYMTLNGKAKKVNENQQYITLIDNTRIPIKEIISIHGEIFKLFEEI